MKLRQYLAATFLILAACSPESPLPDTNSSSDESTAVSSADATNPSTAPEPAIAAPPEQTLEELGFTPEEAAVERRKSDEYRECSARIDGSNGPAEADCMDAEHERQDAALNAAYRATMARLTPAGKSSLRTLQREWLKTFEDECSDKAGEDTLTAQSIISKEIECRLDETIKRTIWLENYR